MTTMTPTRVATTAIALGSTWGAAALAKGRYSHLLLTALGTATVVRMRRYF